MKRMFTGFPSFIYQGVFPVVCNNLKISKTWMFVSCDLKQINNIIYAARMSQKNFFNGTDLTRQGKLLPSVGMKEAADMLIAFLREVKSECGAKPILVCYGGDI